MKFLLIIIFIHVFLDCLFALKSRYNPFFDGTCIKPSECKDGILNNLCADNSLQFCFNASNIPYPSVNEIKYEDYHFKNLSGDSLRINAIWKYIQPPSDDCFHKAIYLTLLAHESNNFMLMEEEGNDESFKKYDGLYGNMPNSNDSSEFRGRGFLKLIGRENYRLAGNETGYDLENNPELAAIPGIASKVSLWIWKKNGLSNFVDGSFYSFSNLVFNYYQNMKSLNEITILYEKVSNFDRMYCGKLFKGYGESCGSNANYKPLCVKGLENKNYCGCNGEIINQQQEDIKNPNIKCCYEKYHKNLDLAILLDTSEVDLDNFDKMKGFLNNFVDNLNIGLDETRISLINFGFDCQILTNLTTNLNKTKLLDIIENITQKRGLPNAHLAFKFLVDIFKDGMRDLKYGIPRVIIFLSKGKSEMRINTYVSELEKLNIKLIIVGYGSKIPIITQIKDELVFSLASDKSLYLINSLNSLSKIKDDLLQLCFNQPVLLPSKTLNITIKKNEYKYFNYYISKKINSIKIIDVVGQINFYTSYVNFFPNEYDNLKMKRELTFTNFSSTNSTLYLGIKGVNETNVFHVEVEESLITTTSKKSSSVGGIVAGVIIAVIVVIAIGVGIFFIYRKRGKLF